MSTASSSTLRVLFFGPVRTQLETSAIDLACAGQLSADELWSLLFSRFAELKPWRPSIRLARNGEFLAPGATFHPGDEIALIPPVSGG
jgi:molybdopterin converting factor small subunit